MPIPRGGDEPTQDELVKRWFSAEPWYPAARAGWDRVDDVEASPLIYAADTPAVRTVLRVLTRLGARSAGRPADTARRRAR